MVTQDMGKGQRLPRSGLSTLSTSRGAASLGSDGNPTTPPSCTWLFASQLLPDLRDEQQAWLSDTSLCHSLPTSLQIKPASFLALTPAGMLGKPPQFMPEQDCDGQLQAQQLPGVQSK